MLFVFRGEEAAHSNLDQREEVVTLRWLPPKHRETQSEVTRLVDVIHQPCFIKIGYSFQLLRCDYDTARRRWLVERKFGLLSETGTAIMVEKIVGGVCMEIKKIHGKINIKFRKIEARWGIAFAPRSPTPRLMII